MPSSLLPLYRPPFAGSALTGFASDPLAALTFALRLQTHKGFGATPNAPVGLYTDTACTTPATVAGDFVAAWRDELSGSGITLTQATANQRPTLQFVSGKPVVRFDGSLVPGPLGDCFTCPLSFVSTSHIWYSGLSQGSATNRILFDTNTGRIILYPYAGGSGGMVGWYDGTFHDNIAAGTTPFQVLTFKFDAPGTTGTVYRNGSSLGTGTYTPRAVGGATVLGAVNDSGSGFFDGDMSSFLVQSALPTAPQQALIEGFLATI